MLLCTMHVRRRHSGAHTMCCVCTVPMVCADRARARTHSSCVGTYESTFARILTEFDTSQLTLLAWNAPDRPNGFVPRPPPPAVEKKKTLDDENVVNSSARQSWTNSLEAYAEHAVTLMQNLFYTPFSILAHDDGAVTAMHLAAKHSAYVRAVVIWQCTAKITPRHLQELKGSRAFLLAPHTSTAQQYMSQVARVFFNDDDRTEWFERLCSDRSRCVRCTCSHMQRAQIAHRLYAAIDSVDSGKGERARAHTAVAQRQTMHTRSGVVHSTEYGQCSVSAGPTVHTHPMCSIATCDTPTGMIHHDNFHWFRDQVQQFLSDM